MLKLNAGSSHDSGWWETTKIIIQALAIAMVVRVFFYQPFNIPSGSMKKTLLVGDYLFVSKLSYGYSTYSFPRRVEFSPFGLIDINFPILPDRLFSGRIFGSAPKRGDVVVFKLPRDQKTDYIKRVIGLPGDEIQMKSGVLFIKPAGKPDWFEVPKKPIGTFTTPGEWTSEPIPVFQETLPEGKTYTVLDSNPRSEYDTTGVYKVPADHYFMMGDNRDNSTDSRVSPIANGVGFVPFENLIGRAEIIFFSAAVDEPDAFRLTRFWHWPFEIRWSRFFNLVR